jgi:hypothetical protein
LYVSLLKYGFAGRSSRLLGKQWLRAVHRGYQPVRIHVCQNTSVL